MAKKVLNSEECFEIENDILISVAKATYPELVLPETVRSVAENAFAEAKIKKLILPVSMKKLTKENFQDCPKNAEVFISEGITEIGVGTFEKTSVKTISIPSTMKTIGNRAFADCIKLEEVIIPEGVKKIGEEAFSGCKSLKKVSISGTVKKISKGAFSRCGKLQDVSIAEGVESAESTAFDNCRMLEEIVLPESMKKFTLLNQTAVTFHENTKLIVKKALQRLIFIKNGKSYSVEFPDSYSELAGYDMTGSSYTYPKNSKNDKIKMPKQVIEALQTGKLPETFGLVIYNFGTQISALLDLRLRVAEIIEEIYGISKFETMTAQIAEMIEKNQKYASNWGLIEKDKEFLIEKTNERIIEFGIEYPEYLRCFASCPELLIQTVLKIAGQESSGNGKISPEMVSACLEHIGTNPAEVTAFIKEILLLNDAESFQVFLNPEKNYLNSENINDVIQFAIDKKVFEIQVILTNYKYQYLDFSDPAEKLKF